MSTSNKIVRTANQIQKAIENYCKNNRISTISDEAIAMMERWKFCYETKFILLNNNYKKDEDYNKSPIIIKRKVLRMLQEEFGVSYTQATIDYQRAEQVFEMSFVDDSYIKYDILEKNATELLALAIEQGDIGNAKDILKLQKDIIEKRPKKLIRQDSGRPKMIFVEFNPHLLKGCNVIESQSELQELESKLKNKYGSQSSAQASKMLASMAEDVESTPIENDSNE